MLDGGAGRGGPQHHEQPEDRGGEELCFLARVDVAAERLDPGAHPAIQDAVSAVEEELAESGRVVLRASGTEPVIRVMVEGENEKQVVTLAERLASVVAEAAT